LANLQGKTSIPVFFMLFKEDVFFFSNLAKEYAANFFTIKSLKNVKLIDLKMRKVVFGIELNILSYV